MVSIVVTVLDAILMSMILWIALSAKEKNTFAVSSMMFILMIMNLYCIWGKV